VKGRFASVVVIPFRNPWSNGVCRYHLSKRIKNIRRDTFSREKMGPKIVGLAGGTKAEAFEHLRKYSKLEEFKISRGGPTTVIISIAGRTLDR
jgi:hypothetical protein